MKLFLQKNANFWSAGGFAPRPPNPQNSPPHSEFLATRLVRPEAHEIKSVFEAGKNVRISVKTFFFGDHLISAGKNNFLRLFWSSHNRKSVIFELAPGLRSALGAPANT